jgi:hypothetical protein
LTQEEQFNKAIADLVIELEKQGVYDGELKTLIDNLFHIKDLVILRDDLKEISKPKISCQTCKTFTSTTSAYGNCSQLKIEIPRFFFCKYHIPLQTNKAPEGSL